MDYYASNAELYDAVSPGIQDDVDFYTDQALMAGAPVLELACGTGRLLVPIAREGVQITGLDISPQMLAVARRKIAEQPPEVRERIELIEGDMRNFSLGKRFKLIFIAYSSFLHMQSSEEQRSALRCIYEHLEYGGRLVLNIFDPSIQLIAELSRPGGTAPARIADITLPEQGRHVIVWDTRRYDLDNQVAEVYRIFEDLDENGRVTDTVYNYLQLRYIFRWEMKYLLELSGFEVVSLFGDFQRGPFKHGQQQVWVARKSGRVVKTRRKIRLVV